MSDATDETICLCSRSLEPRFCGDDISLLNVSGFAFATSPVHGALRLTMTRRKTSTVLGTRNPTTQLRVHVNIRMVVSQNVREGPKRQS